MDKEIDLSKYQIRTDLAIDELEDKGKLRGVKSSTKNVDGIGEGLYDQVKDFITV